MKSILSAAGDRPRPGSLRARSTPRSIVPLLVLVVAMLSAAPPAAAQSVSFGQVRPFLTGLIPVVGPGGAVGGVSIDADGVVSRIDVEQMGQLRDLRLRALQPISADLAATSRMRKVSLVRLQAALEERLSKRLPLTDEMQNLAGLQRIEYVLVYPDELYPHNGDIVLAGFAEAWEVGPQGVAVGRTTGRAAVQLDDLIVALRTATAAGTGDGITCSIDPTPEGSLRLQRLLASRGLAIHDATTTRLEEAAGPQQITITGVPPGSHFAHVLVGADFLMKRLGMKLEPAPIDGLPSYLELLQTSSGRGLNNAMPRWWLAPRYDPLLRDPAGLAWQLRGGGVQVLSEEGYLRRDGTVAAARSRKDAPTQQWAETMTAKYDQLSVALPAFAELRNCMDLAVVAALLTKENLPTKAGCDLSLLLDEKRIGVAQYRVPKTVAARASLVRKGRSWIIGVSGGVDLDSWAVLERVELHAGLSDVHSQAAPSREGRWWWD